MSMKHWGLAALGLLSAPLAWAADVCPIGGCTVPEPETLALLAVAGLAAYVARRGRRK